MTTLDKSVLKIGLGAALLTMAFGCSENGQAAADAQPKVEVADERVAALSDRRTGYTASARGVIPSGTVLKVSLIDAIDSETNVTGDRFLASLAEAVVINGATLLPKGTKVRGRVIAAEGSGRVKGRASVRLELTDIAQRNNRLMAIATQPLEATAALTATKGNEVHYDPEARLDFMLTHAVDL